jgi:HEAT repeat protein
MSSGVRRASLEGRSATELRAIVDDAVGNGPMYARASLARRLRRMNTEAANEALAHFLVHEEESPVLRLLLDAVAQRRVLGAAPTVISLASRAEKGGTRTNAIQTLVTLGQGEAVSEVEIRRWLADPDWAVRASAATLIGLCRRRGLTGELRAILVADDDRAVRMRAAESLAVIGDEDDLALLDRAASSERGFFARRDMKRFRRDLAGRLGVNST